MTHGVHANFGLPLFIMCIMHLLQWLSASFQPSFYMLLQFYDGNCQIYWLLD